MGDWNTSDRKSRLPGDWETRRAAVKARAGGRCEVILRSGKRCHDPGTDCDHIKNGDDHSLENLQWICDWHHRRKSSAEGHAARRAQKAKGRRPEVTHPAKIKRGGERNAVPHQEGSGTPPQPRPNFWESQARRAAAGQDPEREE